MTSKILPCFLCLLILGAFFLFLFTSESYSERKPRNAVLRKEAFLKQRSYPQAEIQREILDEAIQIIDNEMLPEKHKDKLLEDMPDWNCIGPYNIAGRVKSIVYHPENENIIFLASASGGIWKSTNKGGEWFSLFDSQRTLAFGAIDIDHNNPDIIYAGTGEAALGAGVVYMGAGMFKSTDGGNNWSYIGLGNVGAFSKVYVHPKNSSIVLAGAVEMESGLYLSTDAGATWNRKFYEPVTDISINPANAEEYFIGVSGRGVYYTSNRGETWEKRSQGFHNGIGRVSVQMCASNPDVLYSLMEIEENGRIYKSSNRGLTWTAVFQGTYAFFYYQGFYNNFVIVHPTNPNHAIAGGIDIYLTTDGGKSWNNQSNAYSGGNVHMDQHCGAYNLQNPNEIIVGNDGGVYISTDAGQTWRERNTGLAITQFYALAIDENVAYRSFGGTQDNGTVGNPFSNQWNILVKGDGFRVIVDPDDPNFIYGEYYNGGLWKYDIKENRRSMITTGIAVNDDGSWNSPFFKAPLSNNVFYHARTAVYKSTNKGNNWTKISKNLNAPISALECSKKDNTKLWAGSEIGEFYFSPDGIEWIDYSNSGIPNRFITDIESSRQNSSKLYLSLSGYGTSHVFKSEDNGESITDIGANLPDIPVNALAVHPENDEIVFIATDIGVFFTPDGGMQWMKYGNGLPNVPVLDLSFHTNLALMPSIMLRCATHGRSIWEVPVLENLIPQPQILSPSGAAFFVNGSMERISYFGFSLPVRLKFSSNNGNEWKVISESNNSNYLDWKINELPTDFGLIEITSVNNPQQMLISEHFSILPRKKGAIIKTGGVPFNTYGIAYDGNGSLWAVTNDKGIVYKIDADNYDIISQHYYLNNSILTDVAFNKNEGILYFAKPYNYQIGGSIEVIDTSNNYLNSFQTSTNFPSGLVFFNGALYCSDRDGDKKIYATNPQNGNVTASYLNPFQETYGPRCLCTDGEYIYQVSTRYAETTIQESMLLKLDKNNLSLAIDTVYLAWRDGVISARGCEYDPRDGSFWITDLKGNIYKIAAFEEPLAVEGKYKEQYIKIIISPNPVNEKLRVSYNGFPDDECIKFQIYNSLGLLLGTNFAKSNMLKTDYLDICTKGLAPGTYFLKAMSSNGKEMAVKLFLVIR